MRVLSKVMWNSTEVNVDKITVKRGESLKNNSMEITITKSSEFLVDNSIKFTIGDGIELFARNDTKGTALDTTSTSDDLIFSGILKEIKARSGFKTKGIVLVCADRSYELLNKIWSKSYSTQTAPEIIYNIVQNGAETTNGNYNITIQYDSTDPYTNGIQSKRPNGGSDFPDISFGKAHKPLFEWLDELSQIQYTNSATELSAGTTKCKRPFKYYIDRLNVFHWYYPTDTPTYVMAVGTTSAISPDSNRHIIKEHKLTYSQFGEVNFIIFKAGEDMDNVQILDFDLDPTATSLTTADSFRAWEQIARDMKLEDASHLTLTKGDEWAYPSSYPMTPNWDEGFGNRSVANDSEYNTNFREVAIKKAKSKTQAAFSTTGNPRWKGNIKIRGENIEPTELIQFSDSTLGLNNLYVRVKTVTHNIDKNGFTTQLDVEEDIPEVN